MRNLARAAGALLLLVGGLAVVGLRAEWQRDRLEDCEQRGARLEGLALLSRWPAGLQPSESYAGCDVDRVVAYAGRQSHGATGQGEVVEYFRGAMEQDGWQVAPRVPPAGDNAAILCASTDIEGVKAYLNLSVATAGTYDLHIADALDSGARCR
ncbi:hypothetical protein [Actinoplanes aureus]|uniref:Uncharacterized protein n=1 Tax=Actinoplanes aureus TaxID=2792083 RepID=A0A931G0B6_9ACTN|nr:hypothetical protein [Actinoplanes aureus]MBG0566593.1 hypothetical protein [Actinoplanes aureus]